MGQMPHHSMVLKDALQPGGKGEKKPDPIINIIITAHIKNLK